MIINIYALLHTYSKNEMRYFINICVISIYNRITVTPKIIVQDHNKTFRRLFCKY